MTSRLAAWDIKYELSIKEMANSNINMKNKELGADKRACYFNIFSKSPVLCGKLPILKSALTKLGRRVVQGNMIVFIT